MDNSTKKILIIEDDEFLRSVTVERLKAEGYGVEVAVDGESALSLLESSTPSLILLDLLLPGKSGFEVLEKIRQTEATKNIPVIVFSNLGTKEDMEKAHNLGANDFLMKANYTLDDVTSKLKVFLT